MQRERFVSPGCEPKDRASSVGAAALPRRKGRVINDRDDRVIGVELRPVSPAERFGKGYRRSTEQSCSLGTLDRNLRGRDRGGDFEPAMLHFRRGILAVFKVIFEIAGASVCAADVSRRGGHTGRMDPLRDYKAFIIGLRRSWRK